MYQHYAIVMLSCSVWIKFFFYGYSSGFYRCVNLVSFTSIVDKSLGTVLVSLRY
jgi:hypothetical protein